MNAPLDLRMSKPEFDRWLLRQERKYEWKEGRVVQMTNVTKSHARIVTNFIRALSARLDNDKWSVTASDLGVEGEDFVRFPDVIVEPMDDDGKSRRAQNAVILVETPSPSTSGTDLTLKPAEYATFASLEAYIVASQDEAICWVWERAPDGSFPSKPGEIAGRENSIGLRACGIELPLSELYRNIITG